MTCPDRSMFMSAPLAILVGGTPSVVMRGTHPNTLRPELAEESNHA